MTVRLLIGLAFLSALPCAGADPIQIREQPSGLPRVTWEHSVAEIELGRALFFDKRLSADGTVACASCHEALLAFSDERPRSIGVHGRIGTRNAPSLFNVGFLKTLFWDGRATSLEAQARLPLITAAEHGFADVRGFENTLRKDPAYRARFAEAFGKPGNNMTIEQASRALAAFQRQLLSGGSPFDRYAYGGDKSGLTPAAQRGLELFRGIGRCAGCHTIDDDHALFTDQRFHVSALGLPENVSKRLAGIAQRAFKADDDRARAALEGMIAADQDLASLGRFIATLDPADIGKFKTPSLRNVALTAPYMHDGSIDTLDRAIEIELYAREGPIQTPIVLTKSQKTDLAEFLRALTGANATDNRRNPTTEKRPAEPNGP